MVFIILKTNKTLTLKQQRALKECLSELFIQFDVMIQFETSQVIYLNKKMKDCVKVNCIFDHINLSNQDEYRIKIIDYISSVTLIEKDYIFVSIQVI